MISRCPGAAVRTCRDWQLEGVDGGPGPSRPPREPPAPLLNLDASLRDMGGSGGGQTAGSRAQQALGFAASVRAPPSGRAPPLPHQQASGWVAGKGVNLLSPAALLRCG